MKLYRAMSEDEFNETIKRGVPHFKSRFKFFSPQIEFVKNRVMNSNFSNRNFKPSKYVRMVCFEVVSGEDNFIKLNSKEMMCDVRKSNSISWKILEVL